MLNCIEHKLRSKAVVLNESLKAHGVYPDEQAIDIKSTLELLDHVIHEKASPPKERIQEALDMTSVFIGRYLLTNIDID